MVDEADGSKVPDFGASYDKARKAYGLAAGVLLAWELVGIDLGETPIESLNITLKSPQAAPYVLIALVAYFAFRLTVEWYQAEQARRNRLASRIDFVIAHSLGLAALSLFAVQTVLREQLANKLTAPIVQGFISGIFTGMLIVGAASSFGGRIAVGLAIVVTMLSILYLLNQELAFFLPFCSSYFIGIAILIIARWLATQWRRAQQ